jgi:hypothetical protein
VVESLSWQVPGPEFKTQYLHIQMYENRIRKPIKIVLKRGEKE